VKFINLKGEEDMTPVSKIKSVSTRKELREVLATFSLDMRHILLTNAINSLNKEIECNIAEGNVDMALFKMSQVVMLEDELHIVERVILKQSIVGMRK
jgi:enoyl reductase-like protein